MHSKAERVLQNCATFPHFIFNSAPKGCLRLTGFSHSALIAYFSINIYTRFLIESNEEFKTQVAMEIIQ